MAKDLDTSLELTTVHGVTRTLEAWTTTFHLALVVLPGRPEAAAYVRIGKRLAATLGDSDCRPAFLVIGNERAAQRVMGETIDDGLVFLDPDGTAVKSLGVAKTPAFIYIRLNGTVGGLAEGWDPPAWNTAVEALAKELDWTRPLIPAAGDPPPFSGWNI